MPPIVYCNYLLIVLFFFICYLKIIYFVYNTTSTTIYLYIHCTLKLQ